MCVVDGHLLCVLSSLCGGKSRWLGHPSDPSSWGREGERRVEEGRVYERGGDERESRVREVG